MNGFELQQPEHHELTGGDLLAQCLKHIGVEYAFGVHGGHLDAFLMGSDSIGIKLIDTRHETCAVQAAEGYAKVAGKLGVCFVTANSGYGNGLPGLATAFADRSPIFCVTSSPPLRDLEANSLQAFHDQVVVSKPITKFAHRVTHPEDIPRLVAHAIRIAQTGAMGPVLIDFPIDVLFTPVQQKRISWGSIASPLPSLPAPSLSAVHEATELIKASQRPAIIIGTGAQGAECSKLLLSFAEKSGIPIFQTPKFASLPYDHPMVGGISNYLAYSKPQPDLVLLLGARTGMYLGLRSGAIIAHDAKLIHVDTDGSEPGRSLPTALAIVSSVEQFVQAMHITIADKPYKASEGWTKTALELRNMPDKHDDQDDYPTEGQMHPHKGVKELFKALPEGAIIINDGGEAGAWTTSLHKLSKPSLHIISTGYLGHLGNGFGYSIGAACASPDKLIVNVHGDGSAGFHFMELDTFARHNLNILTVVINNFQWGMSKNGQELVYGKNRPARPATALSKDCKWEMVAEGLGNRSLKADKLDGVATAVKELVGEGKTGPTCLNLIVGPQPTHPGTIAMVGMTDDPNWIVVPYYDNIPRAYYKD